MLTNTKSAIAQSKMAILLSVVAVCLICISTSSFAQEKTGKKDEVEKFKRVDEMPRADYDLNEYLTKNLKYPEKAKRNKVEGKVMVRFVVDELGRINDPEVMRGVGSGCDEEALRVVKNMPPWKPAMDKGKPIKVHYVLPIKFRLS